MNKKTSRYSAKGFGALVQSSAEKPRSDLTPALIEQVRAAGKVLSDKNAKKVKDVLNSASVISEQISALVGTLKEIIDEAGVEYTAEEAAEAAEAAAKALESLDGVSKVEPEPEPAKKTVLKPLPKNETLPLSAEKGEAEIKVEDGNTEEGTPAQSNLKQELIEAESNFSKTVKRATWYQRLDTAMQMFSYYFEAECNAIACGEPSKGDDTVEGMLLDLNSELRTLSKDYGTSVSSLATIQASSSHDFIQIACSSMELTQASSENRLPIEIKLFDLDRPSEGVPAVGPGYPLYVPSSVAASALSQVLGLPLDADSTLASHANNDIVGCMLNASIRDNAFWVRGHLYPFNQPERVAKIKAEKHLLGASINALAPGHIETINGKTVHVVDRLTLLGACILYASNATFSKTQLVANAAAESMKSAEPAPLESAEKTLEVEIQRELVAASKPDEVPVLEVTDTPNPLGETIMDEIKEQLALLVAQTQNTAEAILNNSTAIEGNSASIAALNKNFASAQTQLDLLLSERDEKIAVAAATKAEEEKVAAARKSSDELMSMMRQVAQDSIRSTFNTSNTPARLTSAPGMLQSEAQPDPNKEKLVMLEAQVAALEGNFDFNSRQKRFKLRDEIHALKTAQGVV